MSGEIRKILVVVIWLVLIFGMISPAPVRAAEKKSSQTASAKGKWQTKKGRKYFKKADGHYAKGSCRIDGKYYVFSRKGKLMCPEKASLKTVMEETYYVSSSGRAIGGWNIIGDNLYYSEKTGLIKKNTVREGITLSKTGAAKKNRAYKMKVKVMKTVASVTKSKKTKEKKLRACWKYISGKEFRYRLKYPDLEKEGWQIETAYDMLKTKKGNCYSFACAFAAMAKELGYKPYVVCGRIRGSRDQKEDGYTRHAWVRINGKYYDPQAENAGRENEIYGEEVYPREHQIQKIVSY